MIMTRQFFILFLWATGTTFGQNQDQNQDYKDTKKQLLTNGIYSDEVSVTLQTLAEKAIKAAGISVPVELLETDKPGHMLTLDFGDRKILGLSTGYEGDLALFMAYHACGHLYYEHDISGWLTKISNAFAATGLPQFIAYSVAGIAALSVLDDLVLKSHLQQTMLAGKTILDFPVCHKFMLSALVISGTVYVKNYLFDDQAYSKTEEQQADIFASELLLQQGLQGPIFAAIDYLTVSSNDPIEVHGNSAYALERAENLKQFLKEQGISASNEALEHYRQEQAKAQHNDQKKFLSWKQEQLNAWEKRGTDAQETRINDLLTTIKVYQAYKQKKADCLSCDTTISYAERLLYKLCRKTLI
jgi:hypothetical protein